MDPLKLDLQFITNIKCWSQSYEYEKELDTRLHCLIGSQYT